MFDNRSKYGQNADPQWIKIPISWFSLEEFYNARSLGDLASRFE
jgi:hypothetical protein